MLVIIDVQPKELGIPTKAYYAVEEVKEVRYIRSLIIFSFCTVLSVYDLIRLTENTSLSFQNATQKSQKVFVHVSTEIAAHEVEEIGMSLRFTSLNVLRIKSLSYVIALE